MKEKTALGNLSPEQLSLLVGEKTVRERLNVKQGIDIELLRGGHDRNTGVSLFDLVFGESEIINKTNFENISNKLTVPERFQRKFVKDKSGQQSIMRAIFKGQLTNPLYFSLATEDDKLEIVDGQQRWITLKKFINNEFELGKNTFITGKGRKKVDVSGLTYEQIVNELPNGDEVMQDLFVSLYLPVIIYRGTEDEIRNLFKELNTGSTGLNKIEVLLATKSKLFSKVRNWNDSINFDKVGIETTRFTAAELILKLYVYYLEGAKKVSKKDLDALADVKISSSFSKTVNDVSEFINSIPDTAIKEYGKGTIRLLMYILIDLRKEYNVKITDYTQFFTFVNKMYKSIMKLKGKITVGTNEVWWFYDMVRRDDKDVIISLTNECDLYIQQQLKSVNGDLTSFNDLSGIQLRESKRNINKTQRWEVLLNQDSICPECGNVVYIGDDAHHIEYYSKGGPNEVANMIILHKKCHIELHKNDNILEEEILEDNNDTF
jgi:5-methylcytosine-specific restriction endonuclease McrA